jgi:hypothetical protein
MVTTPRARAIFGREPAAWVGLIESVLMLLLAFGLGIDQDTFGPIMAVVVAGFGIYTAWATRDTALGAIIGFVKAALTLAAVYGLALTDGQTAAVVMVATVVVSFFQRTQTSPVDAPVSPSPAQVTASPVGVDSTTPGTVNLDNTGVARDELGESPTGILFIVAAVVVIIAGVIIIAGAL